MHDRYRASELVPGTKVITGRLYGIHRGGSHRLEAKVNLAVVTSVVDHVTKVTDEHGTELKFFNTYVRPSPAVERQDDILWGAPLPRGTPDQIRTFCKTYLENPTSTIGLFHIEVVFEGIALASFVSDNHEVDADILAAAEEPDWDEKLYPNSGQDIGNASFWDRKVYLQLPAAPVTIGTKPVVANDEDLAPWAPGDLVIAGDYTCVVSDGVTLVNPAEWTVVGNFPRRLDVGEFMPAQFHPHTPADDRHLRTNDHGLGSVFKFHREETLALASLQPDEALVLSYPTKYGERSHVLGQQGRLFMEWEDAQDNLEAPAPGLWICYEARGWSEQSHGGDWDVGIEAEWRPATEADLATYGYDTETVGLRIADVLDDITLPDGQFAIQASMAEIAHAEEAANAPSA